VAFLASLASRAAQVALIGPAVARIKRRATRAAVGGVLVLVFGGFGVAYLLIALRVELERHIGPLWAPVAIGGVLCLLALVAYVALLRPRRSEHASVEAQAQAVRDRIVAPARRLEGQIVGNPLQSVALALAVGFAAASLLRMLRRDRETPAAPASPWPREQAAQPRRESERPPWMREVVLRETDRRRTDGKGA
jgi:hypothetical protein